MNSLRNEKTLSEKHKINLETSTLAVQALSLLDEVSFNEKNSYEDNGRHQRKKEKELVRVITNLINNAIKGYYFDYDIDFAKDVLISRIESDNFKFNNEKDSIYMLISELGKNALSSISSNENENLIKPITKIADRIEINVNELEKMFDEIKVEKERRNSINNVVEVSPNI